MFLFVKILIRVKLIDEDYSQNKKVILIDYTIIQFFEVDEKGMALVAIHEWFLSIQSQAGLYGALI